MSLENPSDSSGVLWIFYSFARGAMFFSSHEVCVHYFVTRLLRPLSPQEAKPTTSGLYSWPFITFWLRRHAKDALEKIHWSIATRITHLSCWMHSRKTNNLITDWIVVFLSHLELQTGAKFFLNKSFWTRSFENGLQGDLLRGRPSISRC